MISRVLLIITIFAGVALADCYESAASRYNVPISILKAISKVESDNQPYAINVKGKGYYPKTKDQALKIIRLSKVLNKSFDVGINQINKFWFDKYGYTYEDGLDKCFNILLSAYILAYEIDRGGYNWNSIGRYHSPDPVRSTKYANKLIKIVYK